MASDHDTACPTRADFDPLSPTSLADPFVGLTPLREAAAFYVPQSAITSSHATPILKRSFSTMRRTRPRPRSSPVPLAPEVAQIMRASGTALAAAHSKSGPTGTYTTPLADGACVHAAAHYPDGALEPLNSRRAVGRDRQGVPFDLAASLTFPCRRL